MKLYVYCHYCRGKIYFNSPAQNRGELPFQFVLRCPQLNCSAHRQDIAYFRNEVIAESDQKAALSGAIILGALGAVVGGSIGAVIGGLIGAKAGSDTDQADNMAVERFNNS